MGEAFVIGIIPARMGSSRFPGKPLAPILGLPMLHHVYTRSKLCTSLSELFVATCDPEIETFMHSIGGQVVMTGHHHEGCIDRCAEALHTIETQLGRRVDIVAVIQGDEPMIHPAMIDEALRGLADPDVDVANLMTEISSGEAGDPNTIKVVCDENQRALYFSRSPIPFPRGKSSLKRYKQVCVIPMRRDFLLRFIAMPRTPLEVEESIDMLRVLENGGAVQMVPTEWATQSVDTPQDLAKVELLMQRGTT